MVVKVLYCESVMKKGMSPVEFSSRGGGVPTPRAFAFGIEYPKIC